MRLILYGTHGCHLCEDAEILLSEAIRTQRPDISPESVDIAEKQALLDRYGIRIPVVRDPASGAELDWPFDAERLGEFLQTLP
ncbi:glutaredoxin family protein [Methylocaldum sp. MU1018]